MTLMLEMVALEPPALKSPIRTVVESTAHDGKIAHRPTSLATVAVQLNLSLARTSAEENDAAATSADVEEADARVPEKSESCRRV